MASFDTSEVLKITGGKLFNQTTDRVFTGVSTDTRKIKPGELFVALAGENFDAHDFTAKACENGASGVLVDRENVSVNKDTAVIVVKGGTLAALQKLAAFHLSRYNIPVIAVTGSNGKTTTKDMIASVLSSKFNTLKTQGNQNNEVGLPLTLLELNSEHEAAVVEMAMRAGGEIKLLAEIARPTVAVVTNVSQTHIELLGSIENIASAKAELVESIGLDGLAVLNGDNSYVYSMKNKTKGRVVFYGLSSKDFVRAESIVNDIDEASTAFICQSSMGSFSVIVPAVGLHNVYNALAAITVGWELGLKPTEIAGGLASFKPSEMRQAIFKKSGYTIINDAYNASPASMAAAIETLESVAKGRKIAVLGDMLELGDEAVESHKNAGVLLGEKEVDVLLTLGDLAVHIAEKARENGVPDVYKCSSHYNASRILTELLRPGDTVLFKGSRGMAMEKVLELIDFNELRR